MSMRALAARAAAVAGATAVILGTVSRPAVAGPAQAFYWKWSDGSHAQHRTFSHRATAGRPPDIVVTADPAEPRQRVTLQFAHRGEWVTETAVGTDAAGVARLSLDPYCEAGSWCDTTFRYRLVVSGQRAPLTVQYTG